MWGNRVSPRPRPAGGWGNPVSPSPTRWEGLEGLRPLRKYVHPVGVRRSRIDGCGDHRSQRAAPFQPPPAGGRRRVPSPGGGGSGRGPSPCPRSRGAGGTPALPGRLHRAVCAMRMTVSRDHGGTRFPQTPVFMGRCAARRHGRLMSFKNENGYRPRRWPSHPIAEGFSPTAGSVYRINFLKTISIYQIH